MWRSKQHPDDDNIRWALLRAIEWREWPLFISQPIVPVLLYFYSWTWIVGCLIGVTFLWWFIVAPKFTPTTTAVNTLVYFVWFRFITSPLMAYFLWQRGDLWYAVLALSWPLFGVFFAKYFLMLLQVPFSFMARGKTAQIGLVQERLMDRLGYDRVRGLGYMRREAAADDLQRWQAEGVVHELTPIAFQQIYLRKPGADYGPEALELVDLLVKSGIGVGKYEYRKLRDGYPPRFWRKAAAAANELSAWLKQNPVATPEARLAHARRVVDTNRLLHRSLRGG